ncbi:MAG: hypothetical protein EP320_01705 [Rhodobacteraceae bacterium]|nr:MAG: hypothetical protein EP320_01705 [Paracoccaceae bacterium]
MSEYVFNAASNDAENGGLRAATSLVVELVETLAELDGRLPGPTRALKLPKDPWDLLLAHNAEGEPVSLGEIVNGFYESGQTRELATFFDAMQCYAPAVEQLDDSVIDAILRLSPSGPALGHEAVFDAVCEAGYDAMQCVVTGGTLVSLAHPRWNFDHAVLECDGNAVEFDHASQPDHVDSIVQRSLEATRETVTRRNFELTRRNAFPSLTWGQDVTGQIEVFPSEYLRLAFTRLANLDEMARRWQESGSAEPDPGSMVLRGESELTMQNYEQERRFRSAAGDIQTYETHVWIDRGNRIHLRLDHAHRTVEVGYIGRHLRTWSF